jgi:hypothetical protein
MKIPGPCKIPTVLLIPDEALGQKPVNIRQILLQQPLLLLLDYLIKPIVLLHLILLPN